MSSSTTTLNVVLAGPCTNGQVNSKSCNYDTTTKQFTNCQTYTGPQGLCWDSYVPGTTSYIIPGEGIFTISQPNATSASGIFTDPKLTQEIASANFFNQQQLSANTSGPCVNGQSQFTSCVYPGGGSNTPTCTTSNVPCFTTQYNNQSVTMFSIFGEGGSSANNNTYFGSVQSL